MTIPGSGNHLVDAAEQFPRYETEECDRCQGTGEVFITLPALTTWITHRDMDEATRRRILKRWIGTGLAPCPQDH